jgi:hypothetical protein
LAQSKSTVIAERSQAALEGLVAVREQRAIRSLVRMGAEVAVEPAMPHGAFCCE